MGKRKRLRLGLSLICTLLATTVMVPGAGATHTAHQDAPINDQTPNAQIDGVCTLEGHMDMSPGPPYELPLLSALNHPVHGHYVFRDTVLTCVDFWDPDPSTNITGSYRMTARGATDGFHTWFVLHGETFGGGWSHSAEYTGDNAECGDASSDEGCNDVTLVRTDEVKQSESSKNYLKFRRREAGFNAWGAFVWTHPASATPNPDVCFNMALEFIPTNIDSAFRIVEAELSGTMTLLALASEDYDCG